MRDAEQVLVGLVASGGRMRAALLAEIERAPDFALSEDRADVLIDFSAPSALAGSLDRALSAALPIVIGTTGLDTLADARIDRAAKHVAVLQSANMSLGVTLLAQLTRVAAARLGAEWDIEILEMHHAAKRDAPSGTALLLGDSAARGRGLGEAAPVRVDRSGARTPGAIGYASLRGGTVAGDHDVIFAGPSERVILSHRAESRAVFARGALAAARWLIGKPPGRYAMTDVLGTP
ncbi:MAG TPA: 4-hydroxy-tetrahydrodipicolinate reductase [Sphingomonadaceae bacterium]|nr:4-hydroxy-tetrahydrodipicolinate reductase [Sphingomonadaceae bacterium]